MKTSILGAARDPRFKEYAYVSAELANVFSRPDCKEKVAALFMGEWVKVLKEDDTWPYVRYRGGKGYIATEQLSRNRVLEIFFIDVGQGDAILIQTPDDRRVLIDGGINSSAHEFITNKYRLDKKDNYIDFEAIVCTHSDEDHIKGIIPILKDEKIAVKRVFHNGLFRRNDKKNDPGPHVNERQFGLVDTWPTEGEKPGLTAGMVKFLEAARTAEDRLPKCLGKMRDMPRWEGEIEARPKGLVFSRLDAKDGKLPPFDGKDGKLAIDVLWPCAEKDSEGQLFYPRYIDAGKTVNGNSVVLSVCMGKFKILLTGDLNEKSMKDLLDRTKRDNMSLVSNVLKAAHHGSKEFYPDFLKEVGANAVVVSSGDDKLDQYVHPRAVLIGTVMKQARSEKPAFFCTELAACYSMLSKEESKKFREYSGQLYERSYQGTVKLSSDGKMMCLGTAHGRRDPTDPQAQLNWKWDTWSE